MEAIVGVIIGGIIGIAGTIYTTRATLSENRRQARLEYLKSRMDMLTSSLAEYEEYLGRYGAYEDNVDSKARIEHARIIGKAIAACLSVSDPPSNRDIADKDFDWRNLPAVPYQPNGQIHVMHRLAYIANERLTRELMSSDVWGPSADRNREALDHAAKRLAQLIAET